MNVFLKVAIVKTGRHQWQIAQEAGIQEARLSKFIHEYGHLSDGEKVRLEAVLGVPVELAAASTEGTSAKSS